MVHYFIDKTRSDSSLPLTSLRWSFHHRRYSTFTSNPLVCPRETDHCNQEFKLNIGWIILSYPLNQKLQILRVSIIEEREWIEDLHFYQISWYNCFGETNCINFYVHKSCDHHCFMDLCPQIILVHQETCTRNVHRTTFVITLYEQYQNPNQKPL